MDAPQNIITAIFWILGGLGLFLYGIDIMGRSLRKAAGSAMRKGIGVVTRTRFHGLATGAVVTGLLQSSSASTVMVVGFISAGLLSFPRSISLILGANIGSTLTSQITAFKIDTLAVPLIGIGFLISFISKKRVWRQLGKAVMGFGMLFFGLMLMKLAVTGYSENIKSWLEASVAGEFWGQLIAFLIAMIATAIIQSSAATIAMIQTLAVGGAIANIEIAIPMILGAQVGTCITAMLACLQASKSGKKAAVAHLLFNTIGALIAVAAFRIYANVIPLTSDSIARQIANAHMAIQTINAMLFLPFTRYFAGLVNLVVRGEDKLDAAPAFLHQADIKTPEKAFNNVHHEIQRMCSICMEITRDAINAFFSDDEMAEEMVLKREELTDDLYDSIVDYVLETSACAIPTELARRPPALMQIMNDVERIGDHAENIIELSQAYSNKNIRLSEDARTDIRTLLAIVEDMGQRAIKLFDEADEHSVNAVLDLHERVKAKTLELLKKHEDRLVDGECTVISGIVFTDMITNLRRISNHLRNATTVLGHYPAEPDLSEI